MADEIEWTPVKVRLGDLSHWADNPVTLTKAQAGKLLRSKEKLGKMQTLAIGPSNGDGKYPLYDGHQRANVWGAAFGMGLEVWALQSSRPLTDEERHAVPIMLRTAAGSLDWDTLAGWTDWPIGEWGLDEDALQGLKFDIAALGNFLESEMPEPADAEPQIDRAEELNKKWRVKTGDLWRIGEHRLLCGDSLMIEVVRRVLDGDRPAMVLADPPYGVNIVAADGYVGGGEKYNIPFGGKKRMGYVGGGNRIKAKTGHYPIESWKKNRLGSVGAAKPFGSKKSMRGSYGDAHVVDVGKYSEIIGDDTTQTAIQSSSLLLLEYGDAVHVWFGANYYADSLSPSQCWIVWDKETTGNFADCELAWTNQDRAAKLFRHRWNGMLRDSERERRWHPTQKPAALAAWIFIEFSEQGAIILDPFCGAGWSIIGAENSKRRARVIEIRPPYCAVTLERMATAFPSIEIERIG